MLASQFFFFLVQNGVTDLQASDNHTRQLKEVSLDWSHLLRLKHIKITFLVEASF